VVKVTVWETVQDSKRKTPDEIIEEWCEAARNVEGAFGDEKAMGYLIGEKFLNFLEAAETNREWREAIPTFVAEIKAIFESWKLAEFLNTTRRLGALGHTTTEEGHRLLTAEWSEEERLRQDARDLMLLEWAKELLLEES
jgi:5'-deoxynucleotidase YfbR-like HD superfamily hydrolase